MQTAESITKKLEILRRRNRTTDQTWEDVYAARRGDLDRVFPEMVSEHFPKQIVANFVDTAARDLAEVFAPLPSFTCVSAKMVSEASKKFADKRTKIAQYYVDHSQLARQNFYGADHYLTYGRQVIYLEPDFEARCPRLLMEDPRGGYPEYDRWGRIRAYTKRYYVESGVLADLYPEHAPLILKAGESRRNLGENQVELVRYCDSDEISLVLVAEHPVLLDQAVNRLGEPPIVIIRRPWVDEAQSKGQFDDVIWVQFARDLLAKLQLSAVEKQVEAPLALPTDVQELPYGPDAILRTNTPEKVRRVGLELGTAAFAEHELLLNEIRQGARYPEARTGGIDASIITGRGVEALMGAFDSQIKAYQVAAQTGLQEAIRLAFKMDETFWPNVTKSIRGQVRGTPYQIDYTPSKDIKGDHTCDVSYGFAAGMDPNRAVVMMLQLRAEKIFSRDFFARQLPFGYDVSEEMVKVQVEDGREALLQSVFALAQSIPALIQTGMDPSSIVLQLSAIIQGIQKGRPVEEVVAEVFAPPPPPEAAGEPGAGEPGMAGGGPGGGLTASGLMRGVPAGQAGQPPGGRPDLAVMLSGLTGAGGASMATQTLRRRRF